MNTETCRTVRGVEITSEEGIVLGILGIFEPAKVTEQDNGSHPRCLHLQVACRDRSTVFHASISDAEIQQQLSLSSLAQESPLPTETIVTYLTSDKDTIKTNFRFETADENGKERLQIQVLERQKGGLSRQRYKISLMADTQAPDESIFSFCTALMKGFLQVRDKVRDLQSQNATTQGGLESWKQTAEKLEGGWESEKSTVLENFLALYNQKHDEVKLLKDDLERIKQEHEHERQAWMRSTRTPGATSSKPDVPAFLTGVHDDDDQERWSAADVARLAGGPKTAKPKTASRMTKARKPPPKSAPASKRQRTNEITGATEYLDPDAIFDDPVFSRTQQHHQADDDDNGGGMPRAKKGKVKQEDSSGSSSGEGRTSDKAVPKKIKEEDDETDDDTDVLVDKETQNGILAQLLFYKEKDEKDRERGTI